MKKKKHATKRVGGRKKKPYRVHLSVQATGDDMGLSDLLKRVTYAVGIKPCGGCERRAAEEMT